MSKKVFQFPNGALIDLKKVVAISPIAKDEHSIYYIPVHCSGYNKPIKITMAHAVGTASEEQKKRIESIYTKFIGEWLDVG